MVDIEPSAEILKVMTWISGLFVLCAVAGLIAWLVVGVFYGSSTN